MVCRSMRHECAQVARRHNAAFLQIYLPCSLVSACMQFLCLGQWHEVAEAHHKVAPLPIFYLPTSAELRECQHAVSSSQLQDAALARNERREGSKRMPEEVVRRIATRLEEPDSQKYEWEQNTVTLPSERLPSLADPQV